jgi:predicted metal-dependent TIM-barrel fold hydrolase
MEEVMEKINELRDMIESCIAVGEAALEIPHSEENELIMKGQMMAYDQVLGLIDSLIAK